MQSNRPFDATERTFVKGTRVEPSTLTSLQGWYPVVIAGDPPELWWRNLHNTRFDAPFFHDTLFTQAPEARQVLTTPLAALAAFEETVVHLAPTAFIFHVSRCGSTLLTQLLATHPQAVVLSEPPALDAFFRFYHAHPKLDAPERLLQQLVAALGQKREPGQRHVFIKCDSWHIPWIPFIRRAFPTTPLLLLYREPDAVLHSHQRQRGPQMIPGMLDLTRLQPEVATSTSADLDAHCLAVLAAMFESALHVGPEAGLVWMHYRQLPGAVWTQLLSQLELPMTPETLARMQHRAGFHSKEGQSRFVGEPPTPDAPLSPLALAYLDRANAAYTALERLRMGVHAAR